MQKKPSNRHSLPKVIISEVDNEKILEFKIKYEKLARLDKFEVKTMYYDEKRIVFDEVVNGGLIKVEYQNEGKTLFVQVGEKSYSIRGQKVGGGYISIEGRGKAKKHFRLEKRDGKYYKANGDEVRDNIKKSQIKIQLELSDGSSDRVSLTERELIVADNIKLYAQIVGREVKTTKEIYLAKRFLGYRSDLLFYYGFINNFFHVANSRQEFWKIKFNEPSSRSLTEYFKFTINDSLKNDEKYLKAYSSNTQQMQKDLENTKHIFSALRHGLMHFDYDFFESLFNGEDIELKVDNQGNKKPLSELLDIEFLNIMIEKLDKLNIDTKKEFIDDEKIVLFGEELSLEKLYGFYAHTAINRLALNQLINMFMMQDGVENQSLKAYFNQQANGVAYEVDIHQNREYKALYIEHKKLVSSVSSLSDGEAIAKGNADISSLKEKMRVITKANSLKRLEHKLRLAFGFIYTEYEDYEAFKNNFDTDIKNGRFVPKDEEGNRRAFNERELEKLKGYYNATLQTQKPQTEEKLDEVSKKVDRLNLKMLIGDDTLLKFIVLMFTFMPQELKGEFLGFIKKYYHDTKHIEDDSKENSEAFADKLSVGLKLKVLDKNIRSLSILKHSLSFQTKYNKKDRSYYEDGNVHGKFFKQLGISHNQEEFNKSVYAPLFKYYSALYKLINDFEIYSLAQHIVEDETIAEQVVKPQFLSGRYFNFRNLLTESYHIGRNSPENAIFNTVINMRNDISHLSGEPLFDCPLNGKDSYKRRQGNRWNRIDVKPLEESRKMIVDFMLLQTDMQKILGYDAINDFRMKMVQLRTKLKVYANKEETIQKMIEEAKTPNDYYNIYKVKGVEGINAHLLNVIGETEEEKGIKEQIEEGNRTNS